MNAVSIALLFQLIAPFGWAFRINSIGVGPSSIGTRPVAVAKASGAARSAGEAIQPSPSPPLGIPSDASSGNERRSFLRNALRSIVLSSALSVPGASALAETTVADSADVPRITHRVFVDVRISRADGTFYVRDADPGSGVPADEPFYGRIVLGLFGERTPEHVKRFLDYVDVRYDVDKPLPSYSRSKFGTLDTATGLLIGGMVSNSSRILGVIPFSLIFSHNSFSDSWIGGDNVGRGQRIGVFWKSIPRKTLAGR